MCGIRHRLPRRDNTQPFNGTSLAPDMCHHRRFILCVTDTAPPPESTLTMGFPFQRMNFYLLEQRSVVVQLVAILSQV